MVWRSERRAAPKLAQRTLARGRGDDRGRERRRVIERWQETRDRPGQERLARARRSDHQEAVSTCERDLETSPRLDLTADLGKIRDRDARHIDRRRRRRHRPVVRLAEFDPSRRDDGSRATSRRADHLDRVGQRPDADHLDPRDQARLVHGLRRDHDAGQTAPVQGGDHRQHTRHRAHLAGQRQLTDEPEAAGPGPHLFRADEDPDGHGEVQRCPALAQVRRREVHGDPSWRMHETGVAQRAPDPFARLLEGRVGEADDREPGQTRGDVHLDPDEPAVEAVERGGGERGQHAPETRVGRLSRGPSPITPHLPAPGRARASP